MASLKDKYCIVGVGETEYSRQSARSKIPLENFAGREGNILKAFFSIPHQER